MSAKDGLVEPPVYMPNATTRLGPPLATYEQMEVVYVRLSSAMRALAIVQMVLWFPLGFIYMAGLGNRRGNVQMGIGILFSIFAMAGFVALAALYVSTVLSLEQGELGHI